MPQEGGAHPRKEKAPRNPEVLMTSVQHPTNTSKQQRFNADDYVGSLEDVLDFARIICDEGASSNAMANLSAAVSEVREPSDRDDLDFMAFAFEGGYAIRRALEFGYRTLRLYLLKHPSMQEYRQQDLEHFEAALRAMGIEGEIQRQADAAATVFANTHRSAGAWTAEQILRHEG